MDILNLITFHIVGKTVKDREFKLVSFSSTKNGWKQRCKSQFLNVDYVCNEDIPKLLEWFKCDYSQYRMFQDLSEAQEYIASKKGTDIQYD